MTIKTEFTVTMSGKELADLLELIYALRRSDTYNILEDRYTQLIKTVDSYHDALRENGYYTDY